MFFRGVGDVFSMFESDHVYWCVRPWADQWWVASTITAMCTGEFLGALLLFMLIFLFFFNSKTSSVIIIYVF